MDYFVELGYLGLFIACFLTATLVPLSPEVVLALLIAKGFNLQLCIIRNILRILTFSQKTPPLG